MLLFEETPPIQTINLLFFNQKVVLAILDNLLQCVLKGLARQHHQVEWHIGDILFHQRADIDNQTLFETLLNTFVLILLQDFRPREQHQEEVDEIIIVERLIGGFYIDVEVYELGVG